MRVVAGLIVANPLSAILVVVASVMLGLTAPPLTTFAIYIGGAALALYTLYAGSQSGLMVLAGSVLMLGGLSLMVVGQFFPGLAMLVYWLPVWLAAIILRGTGSLAWSVLALAGFMALVVVLVTIAMGDPVAWWSQQLKPLVQMLNEKPELAGKQQQMLKLAEQLPTAMTGLIAAGMVFACLVSLLIGRWWQSLLVHPGGLREEFYALRLGKPVSLAGLLIFAVATLNAGWVSSLSLQLALVMMMPFLLAGLAMIHAVFAGRGLHRGWLIGLYVLMGVLPQVLLMVVVLGAIDPWVDFRSKVQKT